MTSLEKVAESIQFARAEEEINELWQKNKTFLTSLKQSKGRPRFIFYDGPPFASGLPHYGHILCGTIKDVVPRWAHQNGFHVERRFGWDCHGLPIEYEIDKTLGIKGPQDVLKMGIDKYNAECRKIVMRYSKDWERIMSRLGRWVDFENDYKTLNPSFMESVWWVFKQLFDKGLVYRGVKVMPFSTACSTPISNFESGQNHKEVTDPAVIVSFPLDDEPQTKLLAWTTTPWTLPSHLGLCVHPDLFYVKIKDKSRDEVFILMEARLDVLYKHADEYDVLERFAGRSLEGRRYEPLFDYFARFKHERGAFRVITGDYVTADTGTGVVHQAPYFGEVDFENALKNGMIPKDDAIACPVDETGHFTKQVTHFAGMHVKDADKHIIKHLKGTGRLVHQSTVKHQYPFCWRSETPLIYKAVPSWFINVESLQQKLLDNNAKTYWVPEWVKERRFANWLRDARDWAVSRNRFWGTPIPIWASADGQEVVCVSSIAELQRLTGATITDIHRESIDHLEIPSARAGGAPLRRVSEVFDCWFESGSMPYAQAHYPFENRRHFEEGFPADFIGEGVDQTRGWFYTLLVLSTALFDKPPFKNLIVNGLVMASDGSKMSKRLRNYPDPMEVVDKYGADALRLYLINSPVVKAENLRFREEGVRDLLKDVFIPWYNAYRFLVQNIHSFEVLTGDRFTAKLVKSANVMDVWIVSYTNSLVDFVRKEMDAYRLYTVVPRLVKFVDTLTNWYVRMNRRRIKGEAGRTEAEASLETLFHVLQLMVRLMAPFTPFLTERMWRNMRHALDPLAADLDAAAESVHFLLLPHADASLIDAAVERRVAAMQTVIELGRVARDHRALPFKFPLSELIVISRDAAFRDDVRQMEAYIVEEVNVRRLTLSTEKAGWGVRLKAEPDFRALGHRLKGDGPAVFAAIKGLSDDKLEQFLVTRKLTVNGHELTDDDIKVSYAVDDAKTKAHYEAVADNQVIVLLDTTADAQMQVEGMAREIISRVQKLRKKACLETHDDTVRLVCAAEPPDGELAGALAARRDAIAAATRQPIDVRAAAADVAAPTSAAVLADESTVVRGAHLRLMLVRPAAAAAAAAADGLRFVRLVLAGEATEPRTVLLEQPSPGMNVLSHEELLRQTRQLFGVWTARRVKLFADADMKQPLAHGVQLTALAGSTLFVHVEV